MKKKIKKNIQKVFSHRSVIVEDAITGQKEIARHWKLFGFVVKITYEPLDECHHSPYLGIN